MYKIIIITTFGAVMVVAVGVYTFSHGSASTPMRPQSVKLEQATPGLAAPLSRQQKESSTPPPPPRPGGELRAKPSPEPQRALLGTTTKQLEQVERQLPAGSKIATYAISETAQGAALASSDLSGDGNTETIVVYHSPGTDPIGGGQPLFLGVLSLRENKLVLGSTAPLHGGLIYTSFHDKQAVPFAIRDVTGDRRPEIIVTSGVGASLGGWLQIYAFDGSSLREIGSANGHVLDLNINGRGKPSEITAQSRYETKPRIYRWNGRQFEP